MLKLAAATPELRPDWVERALAHWDEVLLDHAHCEKKAAGTAVNLLFRYPQHAFLQDPLSRLAREELAHFEEVLRQLERHGLTFGRQKPSPYGGKLHAQVRNREPERLLDWLLICALIEARSCERLKLLAEALGDPELAAFYRGLLAAEARHHQIYVQLACQHRSADEVDARLAELAEVEAAILREPAELVRLHT